VEAEGAEKVTFLPVQAWSLGERKKESFYQCLLGRREERKFTFFNTNALVEVEETEKIKFYKCMLGG